MLLFLLLLHRPAIIYLILVIGNSERERLNLMFKYLASDALQHSPLLDKTGAYVKAPLNAPLANHVPPDASMGMRSKSTLLPRNTMLNDSVYYRQEECLDDTLSTLTKSDRSIHVFETLSGTS